MKSYLFAAAALISAVAQGSVLKRSGDDSTAPKPPTGQPPISDGILPCGATSSFQYTVVAGDKLYQISGRFGAGVCDIAVASGIKNINLIDVGQVLTIPVGCTHIDNSTCVAFPERDATEVGVFGLPSAYTVVSGDTLTAIAKDFNITLPSLIGANSQIPDPDKIDVGQVINIPVYPNSQCERVGTYNIASGDLFVDLANKYHSTIGQIKALNPTAVPTKLDVGQQIILPQDCKNVTTSVLKY